MKKLLIVLALLFTAAPAFAARTSSTYLIPTTLLDNSPTSVSASVKTGSADKIACFVKYDETEVGNSVSAAVTIFMSTDNATWLQASFYDFAGGATLQNSETISADGNYYFWFNRDLAMPYVKVTIAATNSDADDTAAVSAQLITQER